MVALTQLPLEVLHSIFGFVSPQDLSTIPLVCRYFYDVVPGNAVLWRDVYHRTLDEPSSNDLDWERELRDLVRLQALSTIKRTDKAAELPFVYNTATRLLKNSGSRGLPRASRSVTHPASRNASVLNTFFEHEENRDAFLTRSSLFRRLRGEGPMTQSVSGEEDEEERQQSAELHCLYGVSILRHGNGARRRTYPLACSRVYDLRQYTERTRWGPFRDDGSDRVDWEKVETVLVVLRSNIKNKNLDTFPIFANFWNSPFAGVWPNSYIPSPLGRELTALELRDPYDITGTWLRVVCFVDYSVFFHYNFPLGDGVGDDEPRPELDTDEATRLLLMKIHVTAIEPPGGDEDEGEEMEEKQKESEKGKNAEGFPIVHFAGFSRALDGSWDENARSDLRGSVRMTPEGSVRWTTFSIFNGEDRWRSEGVQVGGRRSARGVVGNWFDTDYDPHGPCGPTAFWKISDREYKGDDHRVLLNDFLPIVDGYEDEFDQDYSEDDDGDDHFGPGISFAPELGIIAIEDDESD